MRGVRCWALLSDETRCEFRALPGGYFCQHHRLDCLRNPALVFRAPVAEMPPDLVERLRAAAPDLVFPEPSPVSVPEPEASLPAPSAPAPEQHSHCPPDPGALVAGAHSAEPVLGREAGPDRAAEQPEAPAAGSENEPDGPSLDWLLDVLKEVTLGVAASDSPPLQKANAVARLGNLYLKAHGAAELKRENAMLRKQLAEREQHRAAVDNCAGHSPMQATDRGLLSPEVGGRARVPTQWVDGGRKQTRSPNVSPQLPPPERPLAGPGDTVVQPPSELPETDSSPGPRCGSSPRHKPGRSGGGRRR
jgi:hypothetical protein